MIAESWMNDVACFLGKEPTHVRYMNLFREGQKTHYNQTVESNSLERCWVECIKQCEYERRKAEVDDFNKKSRWKKRGVTIIPTMYGIGFCKSFLNQAGEEN